jgi:hypothetical protein
MNAVSRPYTLKTSMLCIGMVVVGLMYGRLYAACNTAGCDEECSTNTGFCTTTKNGYYYSVGLANTYCHPTGTGGTPDTSQTVNKTTIQNGSCARDCSQDQHPTTGNPVEDEDSMSDTQNADIYTKCTKSSG